MKPLTDNTRSNDRLDDSLLPSLERYAWEKLEDLVEDWPHLLVYPPDLTTIKDGLGDRFLFGINHRKGESFIQTGNVVGRFGIPDGSANGDRINFEIRSRFDECDGRQFFLFYLLERVFGAHVVDLPSSVSDSDQVVDFAIFLFPAALKAALGRGLFRAYWTFMRNDSFVSGSLDLDRHFQSNIPFAGRIAYNERERTTDNDLMQLVRHTLEYIASGRYRGVLTADREMRMCVTSVRDATPSYEKGRRQSVIARNLRPVRHPYYTEYTYLQRICLKILRRERLSYSSSQMDIAGIVFSADWLWEEYLANVLKDGLSTWNGYHLSHPQNRDATKGEHIRLFKDRKSPVYPDFMLGEPITKTSQEKFAIFDAKYKRLTRKDGKSACVGRDDRMQMITYLHVTKARCGLFLFPKTKRDQITVDDEDGTDKKLVGEEAMLLGHLHGYEYAGGGFPEIGVVPFVVPNYCQTDTFVDFRGKMMEAERNFIYNVKDALSGNKQRAQKRE